MKKKAYIIADLDKGTCEVVNDYDVAEFPNSYRVSGGRAVAHTGSTQYTHSGKIVMGMNYQKIGDELTEVANGDKILPMVDHGNGISIAEEIAKHHSIIGSWKKVFGDMKVTF